METLRVDINYIGVDGFHYRSTAWMRAFTTESTPVAVSLNYTCPVAAYSDEQLQALLALTSLANVTTPNLQG